MPVRVCGLLVLLVLPVGAGDGNTLPEADAMALRPAAIMNEATGAIIGGAVCAGVFGFLMDQIADPSTDIWKTFGGAVVGGSLGYPLFCGLGAYVGGKMSGEHGRLGPTLVGALTATPLALTVAWGAKLLEEAPKPAPTPTPLYVAAALLPPAGAVIGYNWNARGGPVVSSSAFSVGVPALGFRQTTGHAPSVDLRLVNVEF
ncbi:MAG: hypothetical protein JSU73_03615 [candidate division WOR-3 bacterium]|nr:MAG: hypothetical protein JSU73_03615 [candidate division WOR-3 bacterium]